MMHERGDDAPINNVHAKRPRSRRVNQEPIMRSSTLKLLFCGVAFTTLAACSDTTAPTPVSGAARVIAIAGMQQAITAGEAAPDSLAVVVYDAQGQFSVNAQVRWSIIDGDGTLSGDVATTDARGIAKVAFNAATRTGVTHVSAQVGDASPVLFEETTIAAAAARLLPMRAATDSLSTGDAFSGALVHVIDQYGNNVPNVMMTVDVQNASEDDFLSSSQTASDVSGVASTFFATGSLGGQRVMTLTTDGGLTISFTLNVYASAARKN